MLAPADAQSDEALARIDDAMRHLSNHLGRGVNRDTVEWRWTETIFPDTSLGCPADGITYSQQQTRGFQVWITVENVEYDYRLPAESSAIVLCVGGHPDRSSVGVALPPEVPGEEFADAIEQPLAPSRWWAWAYVIETNTLYLLNPEGEQVSLPRPQLPGEQPGTTPKLAFSRDGRSLIIVAQLSSGVRGIGFYALETGLFKRVHEVRPNEDIYLGFGYDDSSIAGSPYIANPDSSLVAVGLANTDFLNPTWRVIVFDLNTGEAVYQLDNRNPLVSAYVASDGSIFFPRIVYYGNDVIHVQLVRFAAGAGESHPAFAWHPNSNFVEPSPFNYTNIDILPGAETAAFAYVDASQPIAPNPIGALNAVAIGQPATPQQIYLNSGLSQSVPRWASGGSLVVFKSVDGANNQYWSAIDVRNGNPLTIDPATAAVVGTVDGYLTRSQTGQIVAYDVSGGSVSLWQSPETTHAVIVWSSPPEAEFGLSSIYVPLNLTGIVHCPNTPKSLVAIGMNARVTLLEGGSSLRLRATAGGEFLFSMPAGTRFVIIGGPQCQGDYTWWQIRLRDGTVGWAAEADFSDYFMEPVPEAE